MSLAVRSMRRRVRNVLPPRMYEGVRYVRAKYGHALFLLRLHRILKRTNHPPGRITGIRPVDRRASPPTTVLFYPGSPGPRDLASNLCEMLGYKMTTDPDGPWDVALKWHDTTVSDRTIFNRLPPGIRVINRESIDISKRTVDRAMRDVFGYSAGIDPTRYEGLAVRKSNLNGMHDGQVIRCPVPAETLKPGCVYEKLVDSTLAADIVYAYRVAVHGARIPIVYQVYRPVQWRFQSRSESRRLHVGGHIHIAAAEEVFSPDEIASILAFARLMGLDFGALDVLRDNADGRIYIVDANNTPLGPSQRMSRAASRVVNARLAESFAELVQAARRTDAGGEPRPLVSTQPGGVR